MTDPSPDAPSPGSAEPGQSEPHPSEPGASGGDGYRRPRPSRLEADLAALVALAVAGVAAIMLIAGHHPWDGGVVMVVSRTHGVHRGDVMSVGPLVVGVLLARWCHRQGPG